MGLGFKEEGREEDCQADALECEAQEVLPLLEKLKAGWEMSRRRDPPDPGSLGTKQGIARPGSSRRSGELAFNRGRTKR